MEPQVEKEMPVTSTSPAGSKADEMDAKDSYNSSGAMNFASVDWAVEENDPLFDPNAAGFSNSSHPHTSNTNALNENIAENDLFAAHNDFLAVDPREVRRAETAPMVLTIIGSDGSLCIGDDVDEAAPGEEYRYTEEYHALYYSKMPRDPRMPLPLTRRRLMTFGASGSNTSTSRKLNAAVGSGTAMNELTAAKEESTSDREAAAGQRMADVRKEGAAGESGTPMQRAGSDTTKKHTRSRSKDHEEEGKAEDKDSNSLSAKKGRTAEVHTTAKRSVATNNSNNSSSSGNGEVLGNKPRSGNYPSRSKSNNAVHSRLNVNGAVGDERDVAELLDAKGTNKEGDTREPRAKTNNNSNNNSSSSGSKTSGAAARAVLLSTNSLDTLVQDVADTEAADALHAAGSKEPSTEAGFAVTAAATAAAAVAGRGGTTVSEGAAPRAGTIHVTTGGGIAVSAVPLPSPLPVSSTQPYYEKTKSAANTNNHNNTMNNGKTGMQASALAGMGTSFHEVTGHILECSRDQNGSRLVQHLLEQRDYFLPIYAEVFANFEPLATDLYGNYVIQRVFDVLAGRTEEKKTTHTEKNGGGEGEKEGEEGEKETMSYETSDAALAATIAAFTPTLNTSKSTSVAKAEADTITEKENTKASEEDKKKEEKKEKPENKAEEYDAERTKGEDKAQPNTLPAAAAEQEQEEDQAVHRFTAAALMQQLLCAKVRGHLKHYAFETYGCRAMQKALECMPRADREEMLHELDDCIVDCVYDANANHVVQKILEKSPEKCQHIIDAFVPHIKPMACHAYGCRVLQRIFEECHDVAGVTIEPLLRAVLDHLSEFTIHQYGNYVVQYALLNAPPALRHQFMAQLLPQVYALSCSKFASNVAEKVVTLVDEAEREELIGLLTKPLRDSQGGNYLVHMMQDSYANYVVQRFLEAASEAQRARIGEVMAPYLVSIYHSIYGQHLLRKMETMKVISSEMLRERGIDLNAALPTGHNTTTTSNSSNNNNNNMMMMMGSGGASGMNGANGFAAGKGLPSSLNPNGPSSTRRHGPRGGGGGQQQSQHRAAAFYFHPGNAPMMPPPMAAPSTTPSSSGMMMHGHPITAPSPIFSSPVNAPVSAASAQAGMLAPTLMGPNGMMSGQAPPQGFVPLSVQPALSASTNATATPPQPLRRPSTTTTTTSSAGAVTMTNASNTTPLMNAHANNTANNNNGGQAAMVMMEYGNALPQPLGYPAISSASSSSPQPPPTTTSSSSSSMAQRAANTASVLTYNASPSGVRAVPRTGRTLARAGGPFIANACRGNATSFTFATPTTTTVVGGNDNSSNNKQTGTSSSAAAAAAAAASGGEVAMANTTNSNSNNGNNNNNNNNSTPLSAATGAAPAMMPQTVVINGLTYRYVPTGAENAMEASSSLVAGGTTEAAALMNPSSNNNGNSTPMVAQGAPMTMSAMLMEQANMRNNNNNNGNNAGATSGGYVDPYGEPMGMSAAAAQEAAYSNSNNSNSSSHMCMANNAQAAAAAAATLLYCGGPFAANQPAMHMPFVNPATMNGMSNGGNGGAMMYAGPMPQPGQYMNHGGNGMPPSFMMPVPRTM